MEQIIKTKSNDIDILDFIKTNDYNLKLGDWFTDIWIPLYNQEEILITPNILEFMGFLKNLTCDESPHASDRYKKRDFILFLKENNINYESIDHKNDKIDLYDFIKNDIKKSNSHSLHSKRWIIMKIDDFKEAIMMLNNSKAKEVRKYYILLEKILFDYINYVNECNIIQKNNEILKLQNTLDEMRLENKKFNEEHKNDIKELKLYYREQRKELKEEFKETKKELKEQTLQLKESNKRLENKIDDLENKLKIKAVKKRSLRSLILQR